MKLAQLSGPLCGFSFSWALIPLCIFLEIILVALIWKGPIVDSSEHRRVVFNIIAGSDTNRDELLKAYQASTRHQRQKERAVRVVLLCAAAANGAALFLLVCRAGTAGQRSPVQR